MKIILLIYHQVIYESYKTGPINPKVFDIYTPYKCTGFPGPGHQNVALMNPIREFIHGESSHIGSSFDDFMAKHNKSYAGEGEMTLRQKNYLHNYRYVMSENRRSFSFKVGINHLADRSDDELRVLRGRQKSNTAYNGAMSFDKSMFDRSKVPSNWDWRLLGAVTPVKDQAVCGSCEFVVFF